MKTWLIRLAALACLCLAALLSLLLPGLSNGQCGQSRVVLPGRTFFSGSPAYSTPAYSTPSYPVYEQPVKVINQPILVPATVFQFLPAYNTMAAVSGAVAPAGAAMPGAAAVQQPPSAPPPPAPAPAAPDPELPLVDPPFGATSLTSQSLPTPAPPVQGGQSAQPPAGAGGAGALAVLSNRCARCHTGSASDGGMVIFSSPGVFNAGLRKADRALIALVSREATMPPSASRNKKAASACTDAECDQLDAWAVGAR